MFQRDRLATTLSAIGLPPPAIFSFQDYENVALPNAGHRPRPPSTSMRVSVEGRRVHALVMRRATFNLLFRLVNLVNISKRINERRIAAELVLSWFLM